MVPAETMTMWGVKPGYADQTGEVSVAFTSPLSWPAASGVLAELTFDVQAGAAAQPEWRLQLMQVELATQRGYEIERLWALPLTLGSALPRLSTEVQRVDNAWRVLCTGAAGVTYTLEASADLVHWQAVTQAVNAAGTTEFMDPAPASSPVRFYRVREGGM
jgi:hypothetical protein